LEAALSPLSLVSATLVTSLILAVVFDE